MLDGLKQNKVVRPTAKASVQSGDRVVLGRCLVSTWWTACGTWWHLWDLLDSLVAAAEKSGRLAHQFGFNRPV